MGAIEEAGTGDDSVLLYEEEQEQMPIWDSVQRGLEKASQEAARMGRTQRLRATLDNMARQMNTLSASIINKTMELYISGQITHPEIAPLCQELENLRQQFEQAQNELRQLQATPPQAQGQLPPGASPYPPVGGNPALYPPTSTDVQSGQIATPAYPSYMDSTEGMLTPPPPPDVAIAASSAYPPAQPSTGARRCPACGNAVQPHHSFCQLCGTPIQNIQQGYQPTVRASNPGPGTENGSDDATVRAPEPPN